MLPGDFALRGEDPSGRHRAIPRHLEPVGFSRMGLPRRIIMRMFSRVLSQSWAPRLTGQPRHAQLTELVHNASTGHHNPIWTPSGVELVHVPKTGGTSLRALLGSAGHPQPDLHRPVPIDDVRRIMSGNGPRGCYVTFLRDPVDRVWSLYWMSKEGGPWQDVTSTLELFLQAAWEANNEVVQYLSGQPRTQGNLSTAKQVLSSFWFVGDFARFDVEAHRLARALGSSEGPKRLNSTRRYPRPTEEERGMIAEHNQSDVALYRWWRAGGNGSSRHELN